MTTDSPHMTPAGNAGMTCTTPERQTLRMLIVIVCYRAADLTIDCLHSLAPQVAALSGVKVAICENGTGAEAVDTLRDAIISHGWGDWVELTPIAPNRGFSGGNNVILRAALAWDEPPETLLLLNADTIVRPGALAALLEAAAEHPEAGVIGPRLEWPDGTPQQSCFRDFTPAGELLAASGTRLLGRLVGAREVALPVADEPMQPAWLSFACALIRRSVFEAVGVLDEGFFLYFDDPDFCRRTRAAGWRVLYWPTARVVHLRGRSNPVKEMTAKRARRPSYWYASRARYYAKHYGPGGLLLANTLWWLGRGAALVREVLRTKQPHTCQREWLDIWTNWRDPLRLPPQAGGTS